MIAKNLLGAENQFWEDVEKLLTTEHQRSLAVAKKGIADYRREADLQKFGAVIYNQGEELTAQVINGMIDDGVPIPIDQSQQPGVLP